VKPAPADALDRLERCVAQAAAGPLVEISGAVTEVSSSHARVSGLSPFLKLGECVNFGPDGSMHQAELVRIDSQGPSIKAFELNTLTSLGDRVTRRGPFRLAPQPSWKGRVINALGVPVDGAGPLQQGDRPAEVDAAPPAAMRRARIVKPLHTGIRAIDLFTPICVGQRFFFHI
jgi:flagellum-specific ATP synthase